MGETSVSRVPLPGSDQFHGIDSHGRQFAIYPQAGADTCPVGFVDRKPLHGQVQCRHRRRDASERRSDEFCRNDGPGGLRAGEPFPGAGRAAIRVRLRSEGPSRVAQDGAAFAIEVDGGQIRDGDGLRHAVAPEDLRHLLAIGGAAAGGADHFGSFAEVCGAHHRRSYDGELLYILAAEVVEAVYRASGDA